MNRLIQPLSWVGAAASGGLIVALLGAAGTSNVIEAQEIVVKSPKGGARIQLIALDDGSARVRLVGPNNELKISLEVSSEGAPTMSIHNGTRHILTTVAGNLATTEFRDADQKARLQLRQNGSDNGLIVVKDASGAIVAQFPAAASREDYDGKKPPQP